MELKDFERWFPIQKTAKMHYIENISYDDGIKIKLTEAKGYTAANICKTFVVHFKSCVSYFEVDERYADGFWIDDPTKAWTFYKSKQSPYIDYLKQNTLFAATVANPVHYVFVTTESIFHIISTVEPLFLL